MLGRNIKYYRLQAGLTQAALAEKVAYTVPKLHLDRW